MIISSSFLSNMALQSKDDVQGLNEGGLIDRKMEEIRQST